MKKDNKKKENEEEKTKKPFSAIQKLQLFIGIFIVILVIAGMNESVRREISALYVIAIAKDNKLDTSIANALAIPSLSAIAIIHAEESFSFKNSIFEQLSVVGLSPEQHAQTPMINLLLHADSGILSFTETVTMALYIDGDNTQSAIVLSGTFDPKTITDFIEQHYQLDKEWDGTDIRIQHINDVTCEIDKYYRVQVSDAQIIITSDQVTDEIIKRIESKAKSSIDISSWLAFSRPHLVSSLLIMPNRIGQLTGNPFYDDAARKLLESTKEVETLYFGATITALPATIKLTTKINTKDDKRSAFGERLNRTLLTPEETDLQYFISLRKLLSGAKLYVENNEIILRIKIDKTALSGLETLPVEIIAYATYGQFNFNHYAATARDPDTDVIDTQVYTYKEGLNVDEITEYDPNASFSSDVDLITGPFGISLEKLKIAKRGDGSESHSVSVSAKADNLPNVHKRNQYAAIRITSITDKNERQLINMKGCGPLQYNQPAWLDGRTTNKQASNTVHLSEDVPLSDIHQIKGEVDLYHPLTISHNYMAPVSGESFNFNGGVFQIIDQGKDYIAYRASGDIKNLLEIRGLNNEDQPLKKRFATQQPFAVGFGQSGHIAFRGTLRKIEIITASNLQVKHYPYTLEGNTPTFKNTHVTTRQTPYYNYDIDAFVKKYTKAPIIPADSRTSIGSVVTGPFNVSVREANSINDLKAVFDVYAVKAYNLENNLSAIKLSLDSFTLEDQTLLKPEKENAWSQSLFLSDQVSNLFDSVEISTGRQEESNEIVTINGSIKITMADQYEIFTWDAPFIGDSKTIDGIDFKVTEVSKGGIGLVASGDVERIVIIKPLNDEDQELWVTAVSIANNPGWELELSMQGNASKLAILLANGLTDHKYPFNIRLQ